MRCLIVILLLTYCNNTSIFAQSEMDTYEDVLREMMESTGSEETFKTVVSQMVGMFKEQGNDAVPEKFWDELESEMNQSAMTDLITKLSPIYKEHLSIDDLKAVIAFYHSPVGKKYASKTPMITKESMEVGQIWGAEIAAKIAEKLEKEGY